MQALELRRNGHSYRAIGAALGVSEAQAHNDVMSSLEATAKLEAGKADALRQLEVDRLDSLYLLLEPKLKEKENGWAIDRAERIINSKVKILGLALPSKIEHSGSVVLTWEKIMETSEDDKPPDSEDPFA